MVSPPLGQRLRAGGQQGKELASAPAWDARSPFQPHRAWAWGGCVPSGSSPRPVPACAPPPTPQAQTRWGAPSQALSAGGLALVPPHVCPLGASREAGPREGLECEQRVMASGPPCAQGQVTRAQEAEENYVIKRELAVVRQQCSSAAEDLQKAQSTIRQLQEQQVPAGGGGGRLHPTPLLLPSGSAPTSWEGQGRGGETQRECRFCPPPRKRPHPHPQVIP